MKPDLRSTRPAAPRAQRGVVLFVALIAMVILSLAGVALLRSIDASNSVSGNVAFRQASIGPVNFAIEKAIDDIFKTAHIPQQYTDTPGYHYYASLQANEKANGVPAALAGTYPPAAYPVAFGYDVDPTTNFEVRSVIERVCNSAAATQAEIIEHCDILPPKVSPAGTDNKVKPIPLPPIPLFRVTVRVDIPNTNTTSYAQAFVR